MNTFQVVAITPGHFYNAEPMHIAELFESGIDMVYVRKDAYDAHWMEVLLQAIPSRFYERLIIPLSEKLLLPDNVRPLLHVREIARPQQDLSTTAVATLSTSIHNLAEVVNLPACYYSCFYSPVFASLSKPGYAPILSLTDTQRTLAILKRDALKLPKIIALGGITSNNILEVKEAGFNGAAMIGAIWMKGNPVKNFLEIKNQLSHSSG